ncbi:MAG: hypothetical protein H6705_03010 [Myxococcales bacterium]|nr:hypothetical protein [Myxococcales bacterium]
MKDERAVTARTLDNLAVILTGRPLGAKDAGAVADEIASGSTTVEAFVDAQLAEKGFARQIASSLVFGGPVSVKERHPVAGHSVLRARQVDGERVYFLRAPCPLDEAVAVHPWWDPDDPIRVCPEAYRPESRGDAEGRTCGASMLSPGASQACGCGPRLMYCSRDAAHFAQVRQSLKREIDDTVVAVVEAGGPIDPLFTGVETVRDRNAEFVYRRARVAAGEDPALLDLEGFGEKARRRAAARAGAGTSRGAVDGAGAGLRVGCAARGDAQLLHVLVVFGADAVERDDRGGDEARQGRSARG